MNSEGNADNYLDAVIIEKEFYERVAAGYPLAEIYPPNESTVSTHMSWATARQN